MNREIKFRAFSKNTGMWSWEEIISSPENDLRKLFVSPDWEAVMQFTGLKDKNGVEIYEGDLLREPAKNDWDKENYLVQEVYWHDNDMADGHIGWQMNRTHWHGNLSGGSIWNKMLPKYTKKMEVIGNIYENPELLTK